MAVNVGGWILQSERVCRALGQEKQWGLFNFLILLFCLLRRSLLLSLIILFFFERKSDFFICAILICVVKICWGPAIFDSMWVGMMIV